MISDFYFFFLKRIKKKKKGEKMKKKNKARVIHGQLGPQQVVLHNCQLPLMFFFLPPLLPSLTLSLFFLLLRICYVGSFFGKREKFNPTTIYVKQRRHTHGGPFDSLRLAGGTHFFHSICTYTVTHTRTYYLSTFSINDNRLFVFQNESDLWMGG